MGSVSIKKKKSSLTFQLHVGWTEQDILDPVITPPRVTIYKHSFSIV